jgi:cyclic beta-1,2-glucan synthetase
MLNPINHSLDALAAEQYRVEPYVVAADVYGAGGLTGRGGWTWYTGSAGWLYRAAVEGILGIRKEGNRLMVRPALPSEWTGFKAEMTIDSVPYQIEVRRDAGEPVVTVNGQRVGIPGFTLEAAPSRSVLEAVDL